MVKKMMLAEIKSIKYIGRQRALNISMKKNKNFLLSNGILTHNTRQAQDALRNVMETYATNAFFILTANNINKVIEALQSRCNIINFSYPKKEEIAQYLIYICNAEQMQYTDEGIKKCIDLNYPSIRDCVKSLQDLHTQNLSVTIDTVQPANYIFQQYWEKIKTGDWRTIKQHVMESSIDARDLNEYF
jgi:DNA polymerase III delta prime subunit